MSKRILLLSIRSRFAEGIFDGTKRVELRKSRPNVSEDDVVLVYVPAPEQVLQGTFLVDHVLEDSPDQLWLAVKNDAALNREEFDSYYQGTRVGFGIFLKCPEKIVNPPSLVDLRRLWRNFHPPQSYRYLKPSEYLLILSSY